MKCNDNIMNHYMLREELFMGLAPYYLDNIYVLNALIVQ